MTETAENFVRRKEKNFVSFNSLDIFNGAWRHTLRNRQTSLGLGLSPFMY